MTERYTLVSDNVMLTVKVVYVYEEVILIRSFRLDEMTAVKNNLVAAVSKAKTQTDKPCFKSFPSRWQITSGITWPYKLINDSYEKFVSYHTRNWLNMMTVFKVLATDVQNIERKSWSTQMLHAKVAWTNKNCNLCFIRADLSKLRVACCINIKRDFFNPSRCVRRVWNVTEDNPRLRYIGQCQTTGNHISRTVVLQQIIKVCLSGRKIKHWTSGPGRHGDRDRYVLCIRWALWEVGEWMRRHIKY